MIRLSFERPEFNELKSYEEFRQYYWYKEELSEICKSLGLEYNAVKKELNSIIEAYFQGEIRKPQKIKISHSNDDNITLDTPLLECGFSFNAKFREYFSAVTGITPFKFNADMAAAWRKVKQDKDKNFTINDMIKVYYGKSDYAKYDHSICEWNNFFKDFCRDENSKCYIDKLKVATILWRIVKESKQEKVYSSKLLLIHQNKINQYKNDKN